MKLMIIAMLIATNVFGADNKPFCELFGNAYEKEFSSGMKDPNAPNQKYVSRCVNGYVQGLCLKYDGDLSKIKELEILTGVSYCVAELKKLVEKQQKAGLIK